jgi:hypothetical protein
MVGEGDGYGKATLWAVDFELFAIKGDAEEEGGDE